MKRAQIKLFETIGVLVIFFFLLSTGVVFYFKMQESGLRKELLQYSEQKRFQTVQKALYLPELECSFAGVPKEICVDKFKLAGLEKLLREQPNLAMNYFGLFGYARVVVREISPDSGFEAVLYSKTPDEYRASLKSFSPVLIYHPEKDVRGFYGFGVMEVTSYEER